MIGGLFLLIIYPYLALLSGADPFDGVTVNAGATATTTTANSTDESFNITMTISGSDGSSQPLL